MAHAFHAEDIDVDADEVRTAHEARRDPADRRPRALRARGRPDRRLAATSSSSASRRRRRRSTATRRRLRTAAWARARHGRERLPPRGLGRALDGRRDRGVGRARPAPGAGRRACRGSLGRCCSRRAGAARAGRRRGRAGARASPRRFQRADLRCRPAARPHAACSWSSAAARSRSSATARSSPRRFSTSRARSTPPASAACSRWPSRPTTRPPACSTSTWSPPPDGQIQFREYRRSAANAELADPHRSNRLQRRPQRGEQPQRRPDPVGARRLPVVRDRRRRRWR